MDGRKLTPSIAIVKGEQQVRAEALQSTQINPSVRASAPLSTASSPNQPTARTINHQFLTLSDIEIPPRFRSILDATIRAQPELIERRYHEYLVGEALTDNPLVQEDDHIKLF